ncbi:MAG TPA: hypothetical protein VN026_08615 [Bacteroidia bacterium]|jgi:hypothetical protein|nr:hypothetical protein [Bacteroidia bacterium]
MAKGLNKHTSDSEELLKRLNTNDSSGLDDFEKEALEGFDSLDNIEEATRLANSLNQKIDEKYFKKENKRSGFYYLSLAAGLVLIVGLSVFLFNYLSSEKKELALSNTVTTEQSVNEVAKPTDLAPPREEEPKAEAKEVEKSGKGGAVNDMVSNAESGKKAATGTKDNWNDDSRAKTQPDKDDGLTSRMIRKEKKPETTNEPAKLAEAKGGDDLKQLEDKSKMQQGPPAGNVAATPVITAAEKNKAKDEESEMDANEKTVATKSSASAPANNNSLAGGKDSKKSSTKNERRNDKSSGEGVATDDVTTVNAQTTVNGGAVNQPKRDENGYYHTTEFANHTYAKPQDYIKTEIDKSEMLKTNVKAFKAELIINDKGIVTAVKFLTSFDNCTGCKKELEKILLNMPGWKAIQKGEKSVTETVSFIYP